jgi:L-glutamine-phosphate cytidylyltransferase
MKAIILAAGQGTRLRPLTNNVPKCMVEFKGKPIIDHILETFQVCGIDDIVIVNGYAGDALESHLKGRGIRFVTNREYETTNMVYSLFSAKDEFNDDLIISYSDIIYAPKILSQLIENTAPISVSIDMNWKQLWDIRMENILSDVETLKISQAGNISEIGMKPKNISEIEGQYIGLISMRSKFLPQLEKIYANLEHKQFNNRDQSNIYMTDLLQEIIDTGLEVRADKFNGGWIEIDSLEDLTKYNDEVTNLPGWRWQHLLRPISQIALDAGEKILEYYGNTEVDSLKEDKSPLTAADIAAHKLITEGLQGLETPYPIISEESINPNEWQDRKSWGTYWMVDPLDGTKDFLQGSDNFTVNIALMSGAKPVLGVVYAPALERLYTASEGWGSFHAKLPDNAKRMINVAKPPGRLHILTSKNHLDDDTDRHLQKIPTRKITGMGSSLKLCYIADGTADLYPRLGPLSEWDIAAASIVLTEAGGHVVDNHHDPIMFDKTDGRIHCFAASSRMSLTALPDAEGQYRLISILFNNPLEHKFQERVSVRDITFNISVFENELKVQTAQWIDPNLEGTILKEVLDRIMEGSFTTDMIQTVRPKYLSDQVLTEISNMGVSP